MTRRTAALLSLLALTPLFAAPVSTSAPAAPFHCQVPCGIYGDTLGLRTDNTTARTMRTAADLVDAGADPPVSPPFPAVLT